MGQNPMTCVSSSFYSHQRWWLEAGWQVVGCRGLGGEKEPPTGWESTSAAYGRPRRRSQGINPVFASSYILPGAPFGGPVIVIHAGQPGVSAQVEKGGVDLERWTGDVQNRGTQAEKEALVLSKTLLEKWAMFVLLYLTGILWWGWYSDGQ